MSRAHRSLWALTAVTVLAAGLLAQALSAAASLGADILVAASALLLAVSATLLIRVLRHLTRRSISDRKPGPAMPNGRWAAGRRSPNRS